MNLDYQTIIIRIPNCRRTENAKKGRLNIMFKFLFNKKGDEVMASKLSKTTKSKKPFRNR